MIYGIVAVDSAWGIGKNNKLLFYLKKDMEHFRSLTKNSILVCGRKTLLSFPNSQPLKGRSTIVLCSKEYNYENCICVHSFKELLNIIQVLSITTNINVIGGGQLYTALLPYFDKIFVTKVDTVDTEADTFFPNLDAKDSLFTPTLETANTDCQIEDGNYYIKFITYVRKKERIQE